ncbi:phage holin family protein [Virgibacillus sp. 179-BFC.A HS]|uniref:Phage holin family protein n=1 Tax=Tigheibacillus jepli TaxID=3035914 RepID=A0ABU5CHW6_9BACI|nr:phage holin family protein [Virgibacillus sp. 179-BFC.A HS]MDY0405115.1 phage holin family protein [Virgibacillus sp. 179-BFC.A HS]
MILRGILSVVLNAIALVAAAQLFSNFHLDGFSTALVASIVLAVLNLIVKPILIVLTLPITVMSMGLFLFVINAITLMITQAMMKPAFEIDGFGTAILAALVISILNLFLNQLIKDSLRT